MGVRLDARDVQEEDHTVTVVESRSRDAWSRQRTDANDFDRNWNGETDISSVQSTKRLRRTRSCRRKRQGIRHQWTKCESAT